MKKLRILTVFFLLSSCTARFQQSCNRNFQTSNRQYRIEMWSGDSCVFRDRFYGIINQEDHSDGIYYFKGDTLVEVGGNYIIKSDK